MQPAIIPGLNARVARGTMSFAGLGFNAQNIEIVYEVNDNTLRSWRPGRTVNRLQGITAERSYLIVAKADIEAKILAPVLPALSLKITGLPDDVSSATQPVTIRVTNQSATAFNTLDQPLTVVLVKDVGLSHIVEPDVRDDAPKTAFNNSEWGFTETGELIIARLENGAVIEPGASRAFMVMCEYNGNIGMGELSVYAESTTPYEFTCNTDKLLFTY